MIQLEVGALLGVVQYLLRLAGPALSAVGALIVIYSDIPYVRLKRFLRYMAPRISQVEKAKEAFESQSRVSDPELVGLLEDLFKKRYDMHMAGESPEYVSKVSTGMMFEYPSGSTRSPFNEVETWRLEQRLFFNWAINRHAVRAGMKYIALGFAAVFLGTL